MTWSANHELRKSQGANPTAGLKDLMGSHSLQSRGFAEVSEGMFNIHTRTSTAVTALTKSHAACEFRELKAAQTRTKPHQQKWAALNKLIPWSPHSSGCQDETTKALSNRRGRRRLQLRCEGGRWWYTPKRHWKTGSQCQLSQLLFSCQSANRNRQLGLSLAWIQIGDEARRETKETWSGVREEEEGAERRGGQHLH